MSVCTTNTVELPGLNCGACGSKSCEAFAKIIATRPEELKRCIHLDKAAQAKKEEVHCGSCHDCKSVDIKGWQDSLGRDFDFTLETLPGDPGPRETMKLHNPMITREMDITVGDIIIGRPLGMSCGCPITHCGVVVEVDKRTGVIVWCVTGPLGPRTKGFKDIGYYSAEAYEGIVERSRVEMKIGMRYWFMPRKCMLQWRHSGLINFINRSKTPEGLQTQIRIEGLYIG